MFLAPFLPEHASNFLLQRGNIKRQIGYWLCNLNCGSESFLLLFWTSYIKPQDFSVSIYKTDERKFVLDLAWKTHLSSQSLIYMLISQHQLSNGLITATSLIRLLCKLNMITYELKALLVFPKMYSAQIITMRCSKRGAFTVK